MLKIDLHTHILPFDWPDLNARFGSSGFPTLERTGCGCGRIVIDGRPFRKIRDNSWAAEARLVDLERTGVDVQVLSTVPVMFCYWAEPQHAAELARIINDQIAAVVSEHPTRFIGLGTLPLQRPQLAVAELERCVRELGFAGCEIGTHVNEWNLDHAELFPVFEAAAELGAALFVHPWDMMGGEQMRKYWLPWLVGMPAETSRAACSLIFGGVLERLPQLRVALAHGGGAFPWTIGRIEHAFHVRPDLVAVDNPIAPRAYLDRFYYDSIVHDPAALRFLIERVGIERVALGSDDPFPLGESVPGQLIESLAELTDDAKQRLLAGTALEFLALEGSRWTSATPG
ncbi:MAG: amidohydrolase [Acidobacteriota bacterium]|nr:MAG: amidohydrolase [Acidobacteriota bacterium]